MTPRDLTADLPAPREDEPASLRDDIADELRDHLECAIRREELHSPSEPWGSAPRPDPGNTSNTYQRVINSSSGRSPDAGCGRSPDRATPPTVGLPEAADSVHQRVLARFGNPRAVARKLWFDAMREKLMGQRLSLVLQGLMAAAVVAMCLIVWRTTEQNSAALATLVAMLSQSQQESLRSQQESLRSQRDTNTALIERLAALGRDGPASDKEPRWLPLSFRLLDEQSNPVAATVTVMSEQAGQYHPRAETNVEGIADLGLLPPGGYRWEVRVSATEESASDTVLVGPGRPERIDVVCPTTPPPPVPLEFRVESPEELADVPIYHLLEIDFRSRQFVNRRWNAPLKSRCWLIADATGRILGEVPESSVQDTEFTSRRGTNTKYAQLIEAFDPLPLRSLPGYQIDVGAIVFVGRPREGEQPAVPLLVRGGQSPLQMIVTDAPGQPTTVSVGSASSYWLSASRTLRSMEPPPSTRSTRPGRRFTTPQNDSPPSPPSGE